MGGKTEASILVPSDISIVEAKLSTGTKRLTCFERIGLMTVLPVWRHSYVKNSAEDLRKILTRSYEGADATNPALEIIQTRQQQVHRMMMTRAAGLGGMIVAPLATWYSVRHYDPIKGQFLPLPFAAYGGNWIGRSLGAYMSGRWQVPMRDVTLGNLPARTFLRPEHLEQSQ